MSDGKLSQASSDLVIIPSTTPARGFEEMWNPLSKLKKLAIPVEPADQEGFFSMAGHAFSGRQLAPVFSDVRLVDGPVQEHVPSYLLKELFAADRFKGLIFNPRISKSKYECPFYLLERRGWSRLIGRLELPKKPEDPLTMSGSEFNSGRFHAAHYCLSLLSESADYRFHRLFLARIFIHLKFYRRAYLITREHIRENPKNGQAKLLMSSIFRKTGDIRRARLMVEQSQSNAQNMNAALETAWLGIESQNYSFSDTNFRRVIASGDPAWTNEAALGLGTMFRDLGFKDRDKALLAESADFLKKATRSENPHRACAFFRLGTVFSRLSDWPEAENCYKGSLALQPSIAAKVNLSLALLLGGKTSESLDLCKEIYLLDPASASGIIFRLPSGKVSPAPLPEASLEPEPLPAADSGTQPPGTSAKQSVPHPQNHRERAVPQSGARMELSGASKPLPEASFKPEPLPDTQPPGTSSKPSPKAEGSLRGSPKAEVTGKLDLQPIDETAWQSSYPGPAADFQSRAGAMVTLLREELRKDIRFDAEGLLEIEKKLRHNFIRGKLDPIRALELVLNCASFLCFYLEQRNNGKLHQLPDQDAWSWHMTFENTSFMTFPAERCWRFLRPGAPPDPGWLMQYAEYVEEEIRNANKIPVAGVEAAKRRMMSSPHKLTDVETDHRRMMILLSELSETRDIKSDRLGIGKLEKEMKTRFRRGMRFQGDGWRLLRCYGHILVETLTKELNAAWFNTNGKDGFWSMRLPWGTFTFPFGKIYRTATEGGSLVEYYDRLCEEKPKSG